VYRHPNNPELLQAFEKLLIMYGSRMGDQQTKPLEIHQVSLHDNQILKDAISLLGVIVHSHSVLSEGGLAHTPLAQAQYLERMNCQYSLAARYGKHIEGLVITEHAQHVPGITEAEKGWSILKQKREIEVLNLVKQGRVPLFSGVEVDICRVGGPYSYGYRLDLSNDVLSQLDVVIASLHIYEFFRESQPLESIEALVEAYENIVDNRNIDILGHFISGNIRKKNGVLFDLVAEFQRRLQQKGHLSDELASLFIKLKSQKVALEINYKDMLPDDILHEVLRLAKEYGVLLSIGIDFHDLRSIQDHDALTLEDLAAETALYNNSNYTEQRASKNIFERMRAEKPPGHTFLLKLVEICNVLRNAGFTKKDVVNSSLGIMQEWLEERNAV
jgi:histidinol phosphatase-like PHP family hydrolase